jgi:formylglycine-generating enzyme required for sulfatase activity
MDHNPSQFKGVNLPVDNVSWNEAQVFIRKLNEKTGKNYRLPTEKEWLYAAQGGKYRESFKYAGSNRIQDVAVYNGEGAPNAGTREVGVKKPNALGIYDMTGNVWEWCQDSYKGNHIIRGGCWRDDAKRCEIEVRNNGALSNDVGFRIVLSE